MDRESIIEQTWAYVRQTLEGDATGHDPWHIDRVRKTAIHIGKWEGADLFVVQLAALLHDIGDWKFHGGDEYYGSQLARKWLEGLSIEENIVAHVCEIVRCVSFKGAGVRSPMPSREGQVVQDADRLDAIGAIGIARVFAFGGHEGRPIYDPDVRPEKHRSFEEYRKSKGTSINHFHEKLLLLKALMNTQIAKAMAEERHRFMEQFLDRFHKEWEGRT